MPRDVRNFVIGASLLLVGLLAAYPWLLTEVLIGDGAVYVLAWSEMWGRRRH
jgi:hypothetical protein